MPCVNPTSSFLVLFGIHALNVWFIWLKYSRCDLLSSSQLHEYVVFYISKYQVVAPTCAREKKLMIWILLKLCRSLIELFLSWSCYCKYSFPLFIYNTARSLKLYVYESMHNFNVHSDYGVIDSNYWVAGTNHHIFISINSHGHFRNCLSKWCWQCYTYVFV